MLGAVALIVVGGVIWWNDAQTEPEERTVSADAPPRGRRGRAVANGARVGRGRTADRGATGRAPGARDPLAQVPTVGTPAAAGEPGAGDPGEGEEAVPTPIRAIPRSAVEAHQSSGWRLGAARRRIAILGPRVEQVRERVAQFRENGQDDLAERQQRVLDRYVQRLDQLRADETRLAEEAAADGTMGDVDTGYEEAESAQRAEGGSASVASGSAPPE